MTIEYIAGFFDGEGSISVVKNRVRLTIPQTNENVLNEIRDYFSCGIVNSITKRKIHWKDAWIYMTRNNEESLHILLEIAKHLIIKQDKAYQAISLLIEYFNKNAEWKTKKEKALKMVEEGKSYRQIEKEIGINRQTICNEIKKVRGVA